MAKAAGISLSSGKQLGSVNSHLEGLPVLMSDATPPQLWHSVIYEEVLAPSILAGTPTLHQTPATSCLGALMLEVQA